MENSKTLQEKYKRAKKRVAKIKGFYKHLTAYLIINTVIICLKTYFMDFVEIKGIIVPEGETKSITLPSEPSSDPRVCIVDSPDHDSEQETSDCDESRKPS